MVYLGYYVIKEAVLVVQSNVQSLFIPGKVIDKEIMFPGVSDKIHGVGESDIEGVPSNALGLFESLQNFVFFAHSFFLLGLFLKHS